MIPRAILSVWRFLRGYRRCDGCARQLPTAQFGIPGPTSVLWVCDDCFGEWVGEACGDSSGT